jgi:TetR/AcrR family transcriptional regulator
MSEEKKISRRDQILQALAHMLETGHASKITTANLARNVGVSEAALYRHFPSKTKMFEGLLEFIEHAIFTRVTAITKAEESGTVRCEKIVALILTFAERNPGLARIITGEALIGDTERLSQRVVQLHERIETQLKTLLRDAEINEGLRTHVPISLAANFLVVHVTGRICQYSRSEFKKKPTENWAQQWQMMSAAVFAKA